MLRSCFVAVIVLSLCALVSIASAAEFTYQGRLVAAGVPLNGNVDMRFRLFDDASGDNQIGTELELLNIAVDDGLVAVDLDFGNGVFNQNTRWLEIDVRNAGGGAYATLTPRQPLFATPVAQFAMSANVPFMFTGANATFSSGKVGIGTTTPGARLDVRDGAGAGIYVEETASGGWGVQSNVYTGPARALVGLAGGSDANQMAVYGETSGGFGWAGYFLGKAHIADRLGIGTEAPATKLHVSTNDVSGTALVRIENTADAPAAIELSTGFRTWRVGQNRPPDLTTVLDHFYIHDANANATRLEIDTSGRVGIGTNLPNSRLHVVGTGRIETSILCGVGASALTINPTSIVSPSSLALNATSSLQMTGSSVTLTGSGVTTISGGLVNINGIGTLGIAGSTGGFTLGVNGSAAKSGGGSWSTLSDARLKTNVLDLDGSLDRLLALRPVTFEYLKDAPLYAPGTQTGMIAQEVEQVFPEWIDELDSGYKAITFRGFEAHTVEALRELRAEKDAEIDELKQRVAELERLVERLVESNEKLGSAR